MDEDDLVDDSFTDLGVGQIQVETHHDSELLTNVGQTVATGEERVGLEAAKQDLDTVGQEGVFDIALAGGLEDFLVGGIDQGLEDKDGRDHVFLLAPVEAHHDVTVVKVVHGVGKGGLVDASAADSTTVDGVHGATVLERVTDKGRDVVAAGHDQKTHELLETVDDEVTAHFVRLFMVLDQLLGVHFTDIAEIGAHHDRDLAELADVGGDRAVVDAVAEFDGERASVGLELLTAVGGQHRSTHRVLVGIGHHRSRELGILDPERQLVAKRVAKLGDVGVVGLIEDGHGLNVAHSIIDQTETVLSEASETVERVNMRRGNLLQLGNAVTVGRRVEELALPLQGVECRRHRSVKL